MTINGLNNQGEDVVNSTLLDVYGLLHTLVEQEIAEARELCGQEWHQRIHDSWDVAKNRKDVCSMLNHATSLFGKADSTHS